MLILVSDEAISGKIKNPAKADSRVTRVRIRVGLISPKAGISSEKITATIAKITAQIMRRITLIFTLKIISFGNWKNHTNY